jgi:hypothetical protein
MPSTDHGLRVHEALRVLGGSSLVDNRGCTMMSTQSTSGDAELSVMLQLLKRCEIRDFLSAGIAFGETDP